MDKEKVEKVLNKILPYIKPEEVIDIAFDVRHTSPDEFTLDAVFVVPDELWDSYNDLNRAAFAHSAKVKTRQNIKGYTGINVMFDKDNTRVVKQSDFER
jgi:hypothetical protein